jgi:ribosomal protein S12 methylthiotransferase accessory factor
MSSQMTVTFPGGKCVNATFDGFEIATDQSEKYGGGGAYPEPFQYFLASLATCAGIYILGFCQKRNIPHDGIRLVQSWDRDEKTKQLATVRIAIEVPADFPEKYHSALVRAANQCAVKKTLENPPEFVVETVVIS